MQEELVNKSQQKIAPAIYSLRSYGDQPIDL